MIPQYSEKHAEPSMITPAKKLDDQRLKGCFPKSAPPKTVILSSSPYFIQKTLENYPHQQCEHCFSHLYYLSEYPSLAIGNFGIGAPMAVLSLEDLIAWGVKQFISIGTAGAISSKLSIGDIVLCEKAIRDEGTSFHYMPPSKYIHAPQRMRLILAEHLNRLRISHRIGGTWTTDSLYRQTAKEIKCFHDEGILTVEMQASALFAVAHIHQIDLGVLLTISDPHTAQNWVPGFESQEKWEGMFTLLKVAIAAATTQK